MNVSKIAGAFFLILLGTSVLPSCNNSKPAPPQTSSSTPTIQASEPANDASLTPSPTTLALQDSNTTLVLVADEISSLDPYRMISVHPDESVASHIWDTLTLLNDDLEIEPNLAESWRLVNNFTWEIKLRQGILFHNGEPFNAQAVRFSIERAESMPGSLERFAQDISLEGVDIIDDYTVRLTTRQTIVNLPFHLAFLEILPPVYYSETPPDQLEVAPVGSGPYRLHQWVPGEAVILEPVPDYWKGAPSLPCLVFQTIPSLDGRLAASRDGQASLVTNLPPMPRDQVDSADGKLVAIESTQRMLVGMGIREESPLSDKRVRQALNYGVNVDQIVDLWLQGYGKRYGSWVNPPGNNLDLAPWPYDPARAQELLAQAGYQQRFTITLSTPAGVYHQDSAIAQAIAQQLGEIGVGIQIQTVDWATFARQLLSEDAPPLFLLGLNSRGNDLEDVRNLSVDFAFNPVGWQNDAFEDLLWQASNTINDNSRSRLLNEAQALAYDKAPWIWLWRSYAFYWLNHSLDWTPRRDGLVNLYQPLETSGDVPGATCSDWQAILRPTATPEPTPTTVPDTPTPTPGAEPIQVIPTLIPTKTPTPLDTPTPTPTPTPPPTATFTPYPTAQPASPVPTTAPVQQTEPPPTQPPATQPPATQPPATQPPPTEPPPTEPPPTEPPPTEPQPTGRPTAGPIG